MININRMSIKAFSLADITTSDGCSITSNAWKLLSSNGLQDALEWPRKPPQFTVKQIDTWQKALHTTFGRPYSNPDSRILNDTKRLGPWIQNVSSKWTQLWDEEFNTLYVKEGDQWRLYNPVITSRRSKRFRKADILVDVLPSKVLKLVTTFKSRSFLQIESETVWLHTEITDTDTMNTDPYKGPFANIKEAFNALNDSPRVLIDRYTLPGDNCLAIANAIRNNKARAITDGSYKNGKGTAGMTIHPGKIVINKLSVLNWSPRTADEQQPY
jgi:hypothetical protein